LQRNVHEEQIFRIDHYLGKDTVQKHPDPAFCKHPFRTGLAGRLDAHVQIRLRRRWASIHRAGYYEHPACCATCSRTSCWRSLPWWRWSRLPNYSADAIHREKLALISAIRAFAVQ
jgi:glucose-6-phosphate 1-dehydrogenase